MTVGAARRPYGGIRVMSPALLVASLTPPAPGGPFPAGPFPAGLRLPSEP
jgi:hypothetical protein